MAYCPTKVLPVAVDLEAHHNRMPLVQGIDRLQLEVIQREGKSSLGRGRTQPSASAEHPTNPREVHLRRRVHEPLIDAKQRAQAALGREQPSSCTWQGRQRTGMKPPVRARTTRQPRVLHAHFNADGR